MSSGSSSKNALGKSGSNVPVLALREYFRDAKLPYKIKTSKLNKKTAHQVEISERLYSSLHWSGSQKPVKQMNEKKKEKSIHFK